MRALLALASSKENCNSTLVNGERIQIEYETHQLANIRLDLSSCSKLSKLGKLYK